MALSQLRPMVIEGDRPAPAVQSDFTRLPDGSLILRGQKPVEAKPGVLAGLRNFFASKLNPQPEPNQWWIPQSAPAVPVAPAPTLSAPGDPGVSLPQYNEWQEIEQEAAKEQRIKEQLGDVSRNILTNKALIEGKWFGR